MGREADAEQLAGGMVLCAAALARRHAGLSETMQPGGRLRLRLVDHTEIRLAAEPRRQAA